MDRDHTPHLLRHHDEHILQERLLAFTEAASSHLFYFYFIFIFVFAFS
jgi:hypothetical protein